MELKEAKETLYEYIDNHLEADYKILGMEHPYDKTTVGGILEAFKICCDCGVFD